MRELGSLVGELYGGHGGLFIASNGWSGRFYSSKLSEDGWDWQMEFTWVPKTPIPSPEVVQATRQIIFVRHDGYQGKGVVSEVVFYEDRRYGTFRVLGNGPLQVGDPIPIKPIFLSQPPVKRKTLSILRERVAAGTLSLTSRLKVAEREALAGELGITTDTLRQHLVRLRREAGVSLRRRKRPCVIPH